jgi:hypothetical protein
MKKAIREQIVEAGNSFDAARSVLEEASKSRRSKDYIAASVTEALEELDYAKECLANVAATAQPLTGGSPHAVYDYVATLEHSGDWNRIQQVEELAQRAAEEWANRRSLISDVVPFDFPIDLLPSWNPSLGAPQTMPVAASMRFQQYRILLPCALRNKQQAAYVARIQMEEVLGL